MKAALAAAALGLAGSTVAWAHELPDEPAEPPASERPAAVTVVSAPYEVWIMQDQVTAGAGYTIARHVGPVRVGLNEELP